VSDFIEDFYYGNIEPQEISTELRTELKKKLDSLSRAEEQLASKLTDKEKELRKWARAIHKYCYETDCANCCFKNTNSSSAYNFCKIGYSNNGAVPSRWKI
jgi:hypothetical protein